MTNPIQHVAIVGTGVIGSSWTTAFLARGLDVTASDPAPGAETALRRAVEALDCTLVYALVPNTSLEGAVRERARKIAKRDLDRVAHTMKLEAQGTGDANLEARIEAYIRDVLKERDLWNEP